MSWQNQQYQSKQIGSLPRDPSPPLSAPSPSAPPHEHGGSLQEQSQSLPLPSGAEIGPVVLLPIVILALVFLVSGVLHLLIRFLSKHPISTRNSEANGFFRGASASDDLQVQLRQLFHLHDSGLDQALIDALPVFLFKEIMGGGDKQPFDCAVCLSEFSEKDKLRLLPLCGHAFHISCIDTWLLSNSTCPLCRGTLYLPGIPVDNPVFESEESRDEDESASSRFYPSQKVSETDQEHGDGLGVFRVRLGKFRKTGSSLEEADGGETSSSNLDARRCYSMGSYQYVVRHENLMVALSAQQIRQKARRAKGMEHGENTLVGGDSDEQKRISVVMGDSDEQKRISVVMGDSDEQKRVSVVMGDSDEQKRISVVMGDSDEQKRISVVMGDSDEQKRISVVMGDSDEQKRINVMTKGDCYSVSKIWLWPKAGNFV